MLPGSSQYAIIVRGTGPLSNGTDRDAESIAKRVSDELRRCGHSVGSVHVVAGLEHDATLGVNPARAMYPNAYKSEPVGIPPQAEPGPSVPHTPGLYGQAGS